MGSFGHRRGASGLMASHDEMSLRAHSGLKAVKWEVSRVPHIITLAGQ